MKYGKEYEGYIFLKRKLLCSHYGGSFSLSFLYHQRLVSGLSCSGYRVNAVVQWEQKGIPFQANLIADLIERENVPGASVWFGRMLTTLIFFCYSILIQKNVFSKIKQDILHTSQDVCFPCSLFSHGQKWNVADTNGPWIMTKNLMRMAKSWVTAGSVASCGVSISLHWLQNSWQYELKQILVGGTVRELRNLLVKGLLYCCVLP